MRTIFCFSWTRRSVPDLATLAIVMSGVGYRKRVSSDWVPDKKCIMSPIGPLRSFFCFFFSFFLFLFRPYFLFFPHFFSFFLVLIEVEAGLDTGGKVRLRHGDMLPPVWFTLVPFRRIHIRLEGRRVSTCHSLSPRPPSVLFAMRLYTDPVGLVTSFGLLYRERVRSSPVYIRSPKGPGSPISARLPSLAPTVVAWLGTFPLQRR